MYDYNFFAVIQINQHSYTINFIQSRENSAQLKKRTKKLCPSPTAYFILFVSWYFAGAILCVIVIPPYFNFCGFLNIFTVCYTNIDWKKLPLIEKSSLHIKLSRVKIEFFEHEKFTVCYILLLWQISIYRHAIGGSKD